MPCSILTSKVWSLRDTQAALDSERLRACLPELDDWARNSAIPSAGEIAALRRIIDRCEALIGNLPDDQRAQTEEAVTVLRRVRAQLDTSIPVRFRGVISQTSPRLFPNVERDRASHDER
ncbi:MAG: hypothetical protein M3063_01865 [Actinomycetota bacterium]|nr:hypothetical protein [Actinomycetota bacterium]